MMSSSLISSVSCYGSIFKVMEDTVAMFFQLTNKFTAVWVTLWATIKTILTKRKKKSSINFRGMKWLNSKIGKCISRHKKFSIVLEWILSHCFGTWIIYSLELIYIINIANHILLIWVPRDDFFFPCCKIYFIYYYNCR